MLHVPALWLLLWWSPAAPDATAENPATETTGEQDVHETPMDSQEVEDPPESAGVDGWNGHPWKVGMALGGLSGAVMLMLGPWLMVPPLLCVLPLAGVPLGLLGSLTAWAVAWALGRRVPLGGLLLGGAAVGLLGSVVTSVFAGMGLLMLVGGLLVPASIQPLVMLGSAPMMLVAAGAWVAALGVWSVGVAVLTGPWARALLPWEGPWNLDLLSPPVPDQARPPWLKDLRRREKQPGWEEPRTHRRKRPRPAPEREEP